MEQDTAEEVLCHECGGKHEGECGIEKIIAAVSLSLSQGFQGTTRWSISDTTAGLLKLYKRHSKDGAEDTINGDEVRDRAELEEMLEWLRWSIAAYEKDRPTLLTSMQLQDQDVVQMVTMSAINQPAYFIAVYHARKHVVMGIRGTYNTTDILTDLNPHTEPFLDGAAHMGMIGATKWLLEKEGPVLQRLLAENPGYTLVLTGHSLGGAVAALMAMLINAPAPQTTLGIQPFEVMCWGYGCAPCVDKKLAEMSRNYISNVVLQDDVVPRVSPAAFETLRDEIQETSLSQGLKDGRKKKVLEKIEQADVGSILKSATGVGVSVYKKIQHARASPDNSISKKSIKDKSISNENSNMDDAETNGGIAAQAVVAVAEGSAASKQELESRRLFAPGILYHIRRQERAIGRPVPCRPEEVPINPKYQHHVIRGKDPSSRFGRIILSRTMLSDHGCFNIRDGIEDAIVQSCS